MKIKSAVKGVFLEKWKTPVTGVPRLFLDSILYTIQNTHFFYTVWKPYENYKTARKKRDVHVLTIGRRWPFQVIEEEYEYACIGRYFKLHRSEKRRNLKTNGNYTKAWKLWGTNFLNELDMGRALSHYEKKRDKNVFQYYINSNDESLGFYCPDEPDWTLHRKATVKQVVRLYLK